MKWTTERNINFSGLHPRISKYVM